VIIIIAGIILLRKKSAPQINLDNPPKFVTVDFIELDKITAISKFRSGAGHDFSAGSETCRSMKHYYAPNFDEVAQQYKNNNNGRPLPPDGKTDINIFSPINGKINDIVDEEDGYGQQIYIKSSEYPDIIFRLFHIYISVIQI